MSDRETMVALARKFERASLLGRGEITDLDCLKAADALRSVARTGPDVARLAPDAERIPSSDNMDARFAWLEAKAIDMGYVLTPEPEHPDSPHRQPIAPDERMRRAILASIDMIENCADAPKNPDSLPEMVKVHLQQALSGADDASNASAEARLLTGSLAKDVAAAAKRVSEWSAAKQDYARRAMGADEGKESEGAIAGPLNLCPEMLRRDALLDRPSDPTPPDATAQREAIAQWPDGCRNPNSCSIHRDCMYLQCKHYERDISGEVDAALSTRALSERKDRE